MIKSSVIIPGEPEGKARPRAAIHGGFARVYTPATTKKYESLIRLAFAEQNPDVKPMSGPVQVEMTFRFAPPKSAYWPVNSKHNGELREGWEFRKHTSKPDLDNLPKAVLDGLNGVAFTDDSQVWRITCYKVYSEQPCVAVTIIGDDEE